jgi:hypothetical protein
MKARMSCRFGPLALVVVIVLGAAAADTTPSALERDPQGWTDLLAKAGPTLTGWTRGSIPPGKPVPPDSQWSLDPQTGYLVCRGDGGHDWLRWDQEQGDCIFHVEWRFTPVEGKKGYNSGVFVRNSADGKVWHQAQTGSAAGGFLFGDTRLGEKVERKKKAASENRVKPAGEWNAYEITCQGPKLTLWVNGAVTSEWDALEVPRGYVGLEAEGWRIEFRNVKLKPL